MIKATVDLTEVDRGFAALGAAARNLGPVFTDLKKPLRLDQRQHAQRREGPEGAWPAKSPVTLEREARSKARAKKLGKKARRSRRLLGRLPGAITVKADGHRVLAFSKARWSRVHQDGGRGGRGARIPARPFLWASKKMLLLAKVRLKRHLTEAW